jgi:hypothetical protein
MSVTDVHVGVDCHCHIDSGRNGEKEQLAALGEASCCDEYEGCGEQEKEGKSGFDDEGGREV